MINARVIADSISPGGKRILTMVLRYPRFIHAELLTHRLFSRNSASSRAIPVWRFIESVWNDPVVPVYWGKNQPGMQATDELTGIRLWLSKTLWILASILMIGIVKILGAIGLHKQIANRLLEPWFHIETIVTATEWDNFFALRMDNAAQPEMSRLAAAMWDALITSTPKRLELGEWHLPFITQEEINSIDIKMCIKMSVARCARVSFLNHDGTNPNMLKDFALYTKLLKARHVSPFEHQATPIDADSQSGNFIGWMQYRKTIPNEHVNHYRA